MDGDPVEVTRRHEKLVNDPESDVDALTPQSESDGDQAPQFTGQEDVLEISRVQLLDLPEGREHVRIQHGGRYAIKFCLAAQQDVTAASIGVSLKNHRGEAICGEIFPSRQSGLEVTQGTQLHCEWEFDALMLNGVYFVCVDVRSDERSKSLFCVEDVLAFEVENTPQDKYVGGFFPNSQFSLREAEES